MKNLKMDSALTLAIASSLTASSPMSHDRRAGRVRMEDEQSRNKRIRDRKKAKEARKSRRRNRK